MSDEPTVTIETGPRKGLVLMGRRAQRYLTDPVYRAHYDTQPPPGKAPARPPARLRRRPINLGPAGGAVQTNLPVPPGPLPGKGDIPFLHARPAAPVSPPQLPSMLQRAGNLAWDFAKHAVDRMRKVPLEIYQERSKVCAECPLYKDNHCHHPNCGCAMHSSSTMTGALWWASKRCPDEPPRWNVWTEADQRQYDERRTALTQPAPPPTQESPTETGPAPTEVGPQATDAAPAPGEEARP